LGARTALEIRQHINAERETIADTVERLGDRLQQNFDWREYVARYPVVTLGLAAGTGLILSAIFKRKLTPQERILEAVAELSEDLTERISSVVGDALPPRPSARRALTAAATPLIAKAAMSFARAKIAESVEGQHIRRRDIPRFTTEALSSL